MNKLNKLTIKLAKEGLKKKEFSSLDLVNSCIEQIKKKNIELNVFLTVCEKEALEQAKKADSLIKNNQDLPLLGIPIALKDIFSTKGVRTTAASKVLDDYVPVYDATVVRKLKDVSCNFGKNKFRCMGARIKR